MKRFASILLCLSLCFAPAYAADEDTDPVNTVPLRNRAFQPNLRDFLRGEDADRFDEQFTGFVVSGGTHGTTSGTLIATPSGMTAYPGGFRVTEDGTTTITYTGSTTTWVIAHKDESANVGTFTRIASSHFLIDESASQPTLPADSVFLMKVTTDGSEVTAVVDYRVTSPIRSALGFYNLADYGAVGGGDILSIADDVLEVVSDTGGGRVYLPAASTAYTSSGEITVPSNVIFFGDGGHGDNILTEIEGSSTADNCVVKLAGRSAGLQRMKISASAGRTAAALGHGVCVDSGDTSLNISRVLVEDVVIEDQPEDGLHIVKGGIGYYRHVTAQTNGRHGVFMDDGTDEGHTVTAGTQSFHNHFNIVRALSNDEAGIMMAKGGLGNVRNNVFYNCEALSNDINAVDDFQWIVVGGSNILISPDVEDQDNSGQSQGISIAGSKHRVIGGHFSALTRSINMANCSDIHVSGIEVFKGAAATAQTNAIRVANTCTNTVVELDDDFTATIATAAISNQDTTAILIKGGSIFLGSSFATTDDDIIDLLLGDNSSVTITSGAISMTSSMHVLKAQSDTAPLDTLFTIRDQNGTSGAGTLRQGQTLTISPTTGETITLSHGEGSVNQLLLAAGEDIPLASVNDMVTLRWDATGWQQIADKDNQALQDYTTSNVVTDRTYDADATSTDELADVLGTLIADLIARRLLR